MAFSVEMPELGESVTEGTITQWLKSVGDTVEADEPLLEVSTDKVDTEIPSPVAGVLLEIKAEEDDEVEVGSVIAVIGEEGEEADSDDSEEDSADEAESEDSADSEDQDESDSEDDSEDSSDDSDEKEATSKDSGSAGGSGEATDVEMPELGESVTEGTITQWLKSVGDTVEADEPLLEVSTDKVDTEIPSPVAGTLLEILAEEDDEVEVGSVIARIGDGSASSDDSSEKQSSEDESSEKKESEEEKSEEKSSKKEESEDQESEDKESEEKDSEEKDTPKESKKEESSTSSEDSDKDESDQQEPKQATSSGKVDNGDKVPYVTPLVRKLADKHGVDLNSIEGTGVGGRIRKQDVLAAAEGGQEQSSASESQPAAPGRENWSTKSVDPDKAELIGTTQKVSRIRQITAKTMVEALQTSAQLTHVQEVDMTRIWDLRKANKQAFIDKHGVNLTFLGFIVKATVEALVSHPNVNASYNAETTEMTYHEDVNIGIAVDTPNGLLVPVIKKAQEKSLPEIAKEIVDLADRARNRKLRPDDISGATFTVTNIGSEGALLDTPILSPPQAGILGTAAIEKRPVVITEGGNDAIAIRQMCYLPFTYDHQVVDGADAGRFVTTIKDRLEAGNFESDLQL